jgi:hypothetical protein
MTKSIYEVIKGDSVINSADYVKRTDADGTIWSIPTEPANSDYQAYLATLVTESAPTA